MKISKYKRKDKEVNGSPVSRLKLWSTVLGVPGVAEGGPTELERKHVGRQSLVSDLHGV